MDTSRLENEAENYIKSQLSRFGFDTTKPNYDSDGIDLKIERRNGKSVTRLINVQCKGRNLTKPNSIRVPVDYVDENFIVFLYTIDDSREIKLFLFFSSDVYKWKITKDNYILNVNKKQVNSQDFEYFKFDTEKAGQLTEYLNLAKIKKNTSLIIDAFALEKAISYTTTLYKDIYPDKKLKKIDFILLIKNIIVSYDKHKTENKTINVFLYRTPYNSFDVNFLNDEDLYLNDTKIRVFEMKINGLVAFEIHDYLERIIGNEEIILIADDIIYRETLINLLKENKGIIIVTSTEQNTLRNIGFRWGDISYPIGQTLGLTIGEL